MLTHTRFSFLPERLGGPAFSTPLQLGRVTHLALASGFWVEVKCFTYGQRILEQVSIFRALLSPAVVIQEDMQ